jgi:hypothetical protein
LWTLAATPERAAGFLKERLRPDAPVDERKVARWIADLGAEKFAVREEAARQLRDLGGLAEPALRKALVGQEDLERRRRLQGLLARLEGKEPDPALLRDMRAILALERMGTPSAHAVLEALARGGEGGPHTRAARAALLRLKAQRERAGRGESK